MVGHVNLEHILFLCSVNNLGFLPNIMLKYENDASGFANLYLIG